MSKGDQYLKTDNTDERYTLVNRDVPRSPSMKGGSMIAH